ncbi:MAG: VCBS repeat-containing protein, partial [Algicola sp.]|nr:VCBS repeat-containing protein [Algicola sp.]
MKRIAAVLALALCSTVALSQQTAQQTTQWSTDTYHPHFADINGDGVSDLLLQTKSNDNDSLLLLGQTNQSTLHIDLTNALVTLADVNGDGFADLFVVYPTQQIAMTYFGHAQGLQTVATHQYNVESMPWLDSATDVDLLTGDFSGDGKQDVLVVSSKKHYLMHVGIEGELVVVQTIRGNAKWGNKKAENWKIADFNGDGRADVFAQAKQQNKSHTVVYADENGHLTKKNSHKIKAKVTDVDWHGDLFSIAAGNIDDDNAIELVRLNNATWGIDENGIVVQGKAANSRPNHSYAPGKAQKSATQSLVGVPAAPVNPPGNGGSSYKPTYWTYFIPFERVDGASYYKVFESSTMSGGSLIYSGNGPSASAYHSNWGYQYYRYQACNAAEQCSGLSPWRKIYVYTTPGRANNLAIAPENVGLGEGYAVSWTPAGGAVDGTIYTTYESLNGGSETAIFSVARQTWQETSYGFSITKYTGGTYTYRVNACTPMKGCSASVSRNQTVIAPNTAPIANADTVVLTQGSTVDINVLSNDTDAEGQALTPSLYGAPSHGTTTIVNNQVRYTANAGYQGVDSFSYRVQDTQGWYSNAARVDVTINATPISAFLPVDSSQNSVTAAIFSDDIGTIKGKAGISGGAASYSVPIQLPPGRAGMQPGVSLNYSSNGGNGLMGQGWSLSAGGGISRCGATYAIDQRQDAVQYNANDKLCLNGQRLKLKSGSYGAGSSTYHPETSPTTLVTLNGNWHSTASSFTVELGNGHTQYYGNNADAIVLPGAAGTSVHRWLLNETEDLHCNTIKYTYDNTTNVGMNYLTDIVYTGNATLAGDRKVEFDYEDPTDRSVGYRGGCKTLRTRRLSFITTS